MKKMKAIGFVFIILLILGFAYFVFGTYSNGFRAGTVIKLSKKGYFFKTYEGQLNLGLVISDDPDHFPATTSNIWEFSVPSSQGETINRLERAMLNGNRVKLHYREKFIKLSWRGDTKYLVYEVELFE